MFFDYPATNGSFDFSDSCMAAIQTRLLAIPPTMSGFCDDRGNQIPFEVRATPCCKKDLAGQTDVLNQILSSPSLFINRSPLGQY